MTKSFLYHSKNTAQTLHTCTVSCKNDCQQSVLSNSENMPLHAQHSAQRESLSSAAQTDSRESDVIIWTTVLSGGTGTESGIHL